MRILTFHVKGFKSLQDVEIKGLSQLNVFVGRNNSGKSAILRALRIALYCADQYARDLSKDINVSDKLSIDEFCAFPASEAISIIFTIEHNDSHIKYSIEIARSQFPNAKVTTTPIFQTRHDSSLSSAPFFHPKLISNTIPTPVKAQFALACFRASLTPERWAQLRTQGHKTSRKVFDNILGSYFRQHLGVGYAQFAEYLNLLLSSLREPAYEHLERYHNDILNGKDDIADLLVGKTNIPQFKVQQEVDSYLPQQPTSNTPKRAVGYSGYSSKEPIAPQYIFLNPQDRHLCPKEYVDKMFLQRNRSQDKYQYNTFRDLYFNIFGEGADALFSSLDENANTPELMIGNNASKVFSAKHSGSGMTAGATILLYLIFETPQIAIIEEPESQLHPQQMRNLLDVFKEQSRNIQFFISTHSPTFVDSADNTSIHAVELDPQLGYTTCNKISMDESAQDIAELLGVRPSDIFLNDVILFVEG